MSVTLLKCDLRHSHCNHQTCQLHRQQMLQGRELEDQTADLTEQIKWHKQARARRDRHKEIEKLTDHMKSELQMGEDELVTARSPVMLRWSLR